MDHLSAYTDTLRLFNPWLWVNLLDVGKYSGKG